MAVPAATVWDVFTDVERVAPCLPGATLLSVDGDDFTGAVKVKVGPITVSYKGVATYEEKDVATRRLVLKAEGKETRQFGEHWYVMETALGADVSLVKAHIADRSGNLVFRKTARNFNPACAMAGQVCVAEVEEIVPVGSLDPEAIHTPERFGLQTAR